MFPACTENAEEAAAEEEEDDDGVANVEGDKGGQVEGKGRRWRWRKSMWLRR